MQGNTRSLFAVGCVRLVFARVLDSAACNCRLRSTKPESLGASCRRAVLRRCIAQDCWEYLSTRRNRVGTSYLGWLPPGHSNPRALQAVATSLCAIARASMKRWYGMGVKEGATECYSDRAGATSNTMAIGVHRHTYISLDRSGMQWTAITGRSASSYCFSKERRTILLDRLAQCSVVGMQHLAPCYPYHVPGSEATWANYRY